MDSVGRRQLVADLVERDRDVAAFSRLADGAAAEPTSRSAAVNTDRRLAALERAQVALDTLRANTRDPAVRDATVRLLAHADALTDAENGPLWATYAGQVRAALARHERPSEKTVATLVALAGGRHHPVERQLMDELDRLEVISPALRRAVYIPARLESFKAGRDDESYGGAFRARTMNTKARALLAGVGPSIPGLTLASVGSKAALGAAAGPVSYGALALGVDLAKAFTADYQARFRVFGLNAREENQHALGFMLARIRSEGYEAQFVGADGRVRLAAESGTIGELLALHARTVEAPSATEVGMERTLVRLKTAMDSALASGDVSTLPNAIAQVRGAFGNGDLSRVDALARERVAAPSYPALDADLDVAIQNHVKATVASINPSLSEVLGEIQRRLATTAGGRASPGEVHAIRATSRVSPSLYEVFAVMPFVRSGALKLRDIWPNARVIQVEGRDLDARGLFEALDHLRPGGDPEVIARRAERVGNWLGAVAAGATSSILGWGMVTALVALVPYIGGNVAGAVLGDYFEQKARAARVLDGVESPAEVPTRDPLALAVNRWHGLEFPTDDRDLAAFASLEADALTALTAYRRRQLEGPELAEFRDAFVPAFAAVDTLIAGLRAAADGPVGTRRAALVDARRAFVTNDAAVACTMMAALSHHASESRADRGEALRLGRDMLIERLNLVVARIERGFTQPLCFDVYHAAEFVAKAGLKPFTKAERKVLESDPFVALALKIQESSASGLAEPLDVARISGLLAARQDSTARFDDELNEIGKRDEIDVKARSRAFLTAAASDVLNPLSAGIANVPKFSFGDSRPLASTGDAPGGFLVEGTVGKDGRFSVQLDHDGAPQIGQCSIAWDTKTLLDVAENAARADTQAALGTREPVTISQRRVVSTADMLTCTYDVRTGGGRTVVVNVDLTRSGLLRGLRSTSREAA